MGDALMACGGWIMFGGVGTVCFQCVLWLRDGFWTPYSLWTPWNWLELPYPWVEWNGIQKIVVGIIDQPMSAALVLIGAVVLLLGVGRPLES